MKRRMEQLINGRFEYEVPRLILSAGEISLTLEEGKNYRGEISIGAEDGRKIKGFLTSDHQRIILAQDRFSGTVSTIEYGIDVSGLGAGDAISGAITVSSSVEERQIPVTVQILEAQMVSSQGDVETLEDFTRLASRNYREAFGFFTGGKFSRILNGNNRMYRSLYNGMSRNPVTYQHLEEFLVAAGKKEPVELSLDKKQKAVYRIDVSMKDTLYIYKNTWGYVRMEIEVQGDFIEVGKKVVTSEDFIGSVYGLEYIVHRERLKGGRHFGKILIHNIHQTLTFELEASVDTDQMPEDTLEVRQMKLDLLRGYLGLLTKTYDYRTWYDTSKKQIEKIDALGGADRMTRFYEVFLCDSGEDTTRERELLLTLRDQQIPLENAEEQGLYLYYAYKTGILELSHEMLVSRLTAFSMQEPGSFVLVKLLLMEDETYRSSLTRQLYMLERAYEIGGCTSPFLYFEAMRILLHQEGQLRRLSPFMIAVLRFGQRYHLLTGELLRRAAYLAGHLKRFDRLVYRFLAKGYETYPSDEVLEAICRLIMSGHPVRKEYFRWYALAVERQIRITRLYEYYIETMSEPVEGVLPQVIRMYFSYSSTFAASKKAFIYANVIRNKETDPATYQSYKKAMEQFAAEQLAKGKINGDYAVLYREFMKKPIDVKSASDAARVLFTHKITCSDRNIRRVIVCHNALEKEAAYPLVDGAAYVSIYSPDALILLEDEKRRRFASTVPYQKEQLFEEREMIRICGEYPTGDPGLLLYLCRERPWQMELTGPNLGWYQQAAENEAFTEEYRQQVRGKLLSYYLAHTYDEAVEAAVYDLEDQAYARVNKEDTVQLLVGCGLYGRAFALTEKYGYERIPLTCLYRLARNQILDGGGTKDEELLCLVSYVVEQGMYDEVVLLYLRDYYIGPVEKMCGLWEKVKGFQLESDKLEERILMWSMFVRAYPKEDQRILESYILQTGRENVILAYFTYISIGYFLDDHPVSDKLFGYLESMWEREWELEEICRLALLKYYAFKKNLTEKEERIAAEFLMEFDHKEFRFAFYQGLPEYLTESYQVNDRIFIEERFSPNDRVTIRYRIGDEAKWQSEPMRNMYQGIFVKEFLLFYGETLEYNLTVENDREIRELPGKTVTMTETREDGRTRYQMLNQILAARAIGNEAKTEEAVCSYLKQDQLVRSCFSIME